MVRYIITEDNCLIIEYEAEGNEDTVVNLTNHSYFNLAGQASGEVLNHKLWIDSDFYTIGSDKFAVDDTSMDFRQLKRIGEDIENDEILFKTRIATDTVRTSDQYGVEIKNMMGGINK